jgi:membrane protein implicated in regulation of membrane protease activity
MKNRTTAIILTILAVILCGCPGLAFCVLGIVPLVSPSAASQTTLPPWASLLGGWCLAIILIAIPIVVGILTLRRPKGEELPPPPPPMPPQEPMSPEPPQEPLPPAS